MAESELPHLLAVLGSPIAHSASPAMQQAGLDAMGMPAHYLALEVVSERVGEAIAGLDALGALGANLTAPLKEGALPFLRRVDPIARRLGAVNTLVRRPSRTGRGFSGTNTDLPALEAALERAGGGMVVRRASVFGAGGTAATSLVGLAGIGVRECALVARTPKRGRALIERLREARLLGAMTVEIYSTSASFPPATVVVNATPQGRAGARPAIARRHLKEAELVIDWVYRSGDTALIRAASERGIATIDGAELLLGQGVRSLALWTGREPGPAVLRAMRRALHRHLQTG